MKTLVLAFTAFLFNVSIAVAGDAPAKAQTCVACHGQQGVSSNPEWPSLAGQHAGYLSNQLKAFRDGRRTNPAMAPFLKGLSDADIEALATYYASLAPGRAANGDASLVSTGENLSAYCKSCHGMEGRPVANTWPIIAGQQATYLATQLRHFKSGQRENAHMQTVISALEDPQFKALAAYYSQLQP